MPYRFIFQGITADTHRTAIDSIFKTPDLERVILGVAYLSENGVAEVETLLKSSSDKTTVYAGVRNEITSYQALLRLFTSGVSIFAVDTATRSVVFHPKVFIGIGANEARALIGSANLTLGGLNNNIEGGVLITLDLEQEQDLTLVKAIRKSFHSLSVLTSNVTRIHGKADIDDLFERGLLVDESQPPARLPGRPSKKGNTPDNTPTIPLKTKRLPPKIVRPTKQPQMGGSGPGTPPPQGSGGGNVTVGYTLFWESKSLTRRDLTIPIGGKANPTGSINLDQGLLVGKDHRSYFRKKVFQHLIWKSRSKTVDEAHADFAVVVKGVSYGRFNLAIRHTTSTTSTSYLQFNAMTRVSWGPVKKFVANPSLIGGTLSLYRDEANPTQFLIEIE